ncbi:MAG: DUF1573 domain-containing protein [Planctomycetales bacterium]|nr:DUF1573 domain-containing protein [Planctomycetales bacterium]
MTRLCPPAAIGERRSCEPSIDVSLMKTLLIAILAISVGSVLGVASTAARMGYIPSWRPSETPAVPPPSETKTVDGSRPQLVIDATEFDFGTLERDAKSRHAFLVRNAGDAPLTLANGGSTCKCTILGGLEEEEAVLAPGEQREVELEWTAKTLGSEFRQTATLLTNDPIRPRVELSVFGAVADSIQVTPTEIIFSKADPDTTFDAQLRILSLRDEPMQVLEHHFQDPEAEDFFHVAIRQLAAGELENPQVRHALEVNVQLQPGLPVGPIDELLYLQTNIPGREEIEVPIRGRVASKLSIYGNGWSEENGTLVLGKVKKSEGARHELTLSIRGEHADQVQLSVGKISTDTLKISFGEPIVLGQGRLVRVPLIIEVPPGSRTVNFLGGDVSEPAEVIIHSTHPQAPRLRMLVRYVIEP